MAPVGTEMSPQLEASVNEMTRCLKSLFSVMFGTSRGEPSISEQQLATISQIKGMLQFQLADFEDYLLVKGQRNVTMTAYPFFLRIASAFWNGFPGLDFPKLLALFILSPSRWSVTSLRGPGERNFNAVSHKPKLTGTDWIELNWCAHWLMGYGIKISIPRSPQWRHRSPTCFSQIGTFCRGDICISGTEIPYLWCKIYLEFDQELWLVWNFCGIGVAISPEKQSHP